MTSPKIKWFKNPGTLSRKINYACTPSKRKRLKITVKQLDCGVQSAMFQYNDVFK